jgi:hypothetical protein
MKTIYPNEIIEYSFEPSLLQSADIELSERFIDEAIAARVRWHAVQDFLKKLYFEKLEVDA